MIKYLYIDKKWYLTLLLLIVLFVFSYIWIPLFYIALVIAIVFAFICIVDLYLLFKHKHPIRIQRDIDEVFHLGEFNTVSLKIKNTTRLNYNLTVIEELPDIFQIRDFEIKTFLTSNTTEKLQYNIKALKRGEFVFERTVVYIKTFLSFFQRRINKDHKHIIKVFPSTKPLKKYQILARSKQFLHSGQQTIRKVGQSMEFDQIREYVLGDDIRNINWKATARRDQFMVNNYIDEKSKNVYNVIDTGRLMMYNFERLSLVDYAVNASILISKIVLSKDDKIGLITYNDKVNDVIAAEQHARQLYKINNALYNLKTSYNDSSFEALLQSVTKIINQRSVLFLYTNFESKSSFERQLGYIKQLAKKHIIVIVFFENEAIKPLILRKSKTLEDVFVNTIAEQYEFEKKQIVKQLSNYGVVSILTTPQLLNTDTINKYLYLKQTNII
jgi:uncharacterized protein (DUF58 family)